MPATVAAGASKQRSYSLPPETGTTTTGALAAWAASTAYVIDATSSGINTVVNGGNIYQCITAGTSAASGGPTGTGTNITDGTAHWTFVTTSPSQDTTSGQQVVSVVARGTQSTIPGGSGNIPTTDNDTGGTYTTVSNTNYNGFADSFLGLFYRPSSANSKSGLTVSSQFGGTSVGSGAGDEHTVMWLSLQNVTTGAPHAHVQVERANATSGIVTGASYTLTKPCIVISVWGGNGNVLSAGSAHTAIPLDGMTLVPGCVRLISLSTSGYIQTAVAFRILGPGTYADRWQTGSGASEGAQILSVAWEDVSAITANDDDFPPPMPRPAIQPHATAAALALSWGQGARSDEMPTAAAAAVDDDARAQFAPVWPPWSSAQVVRQTDEVAISPPDDVQPTIPAFWPGWWSPAIAAAPDELAPVLISDEDPAPAVWSWPTATWQVSRTADGDAALTAAATQISDDWSPQVVTWAAVWFSAQPVSADEIAVPVASAVSDEDPVSSAVAWPSWAPPGQRFDDEGLAPVAVDDSDRAVVIGPWVPWACRPVQIADESMVGFALPAGIGDDDGGQSMAPWPAQWFTAAPMFVDDLPVAAPGGLPPFYSGPLPAESYDGTLPTGGFYGAS